MSGIEGDTLVDTITIPANDMRDDGQNLRKMFNFDKKKDGSTLPIIDIKEKILDLVGGNQIVVLSGPTGCGKSTQVPQYILDKHAMDRCRKFFWIAKNLDVFDKGEAFNQGIAIA